MFYIDGVFTEFTMLIHTKSIKQAYAFHCCGRTGFYCLHMSVWIRFLSKSVRRLLGWKKSV